uniref:Survival of motor neuron-related-splicing factor 30 n=1 Tax=Schistocephalus solidus TaxID=70667 RepID=A0A183T0L2_SCHSO
LAGTKHLRGHPFKLQRYLVHTGVRLNAFSQRIIGAWNVLSDEVMAEEAHLELLNHKLQLQQVEAALELDKENEDLLKLKNDLEEVIRLTIELIGKPESSEEIKWNVGDMCMAMCSRDKLYVVSIFIFLFSFYKAKILEFLGEAACVVNFCEYDTTDVCQICHLKPLTGVAAPVQRTKREVKHRAIEKKKMKKMKISQRREELEKACEREKNQWLNFNKKMVKTGKIRKSIFASPETIDGRVGIGTCGIAGRPMTKFNTHARNVRR